jgi:hypothetical protein
MLGICKEMVSLDTYYSYINTHINMILVSLSSRQKHSIKDPGTYIMFLDIIHRSFLLSKTLFCFISKYNVSETALCLRLQVKPTQSGSNDTAIPYLRTWCLLIQYHIEIKTGICTH